MERAFQMVGMVVVKTKISLNQVVPETAQSSKKPRFVFDVDQWDEAPRVGVRADTVGDNENTVCRINGTRKCNKHEHTAAVGLSQQLLYDTWRNTWRTGRLLTRQDAADWFRHVYRELNSPPDRLANPCIPRKAPVLSHTDGIHPFLKVHFDGRSRNARAGFLRGAAWADCGCEGGDGCRL